MASLITPPALRSTRSRVDDLLFRICEKVQLSPTQQEEAKRSYNAICNWLDANDSSLQIYRPSLFPQGSIALGTTVKPTGRDEYDVDLVCQLNIDSRTVSNPVVLLDMIEQRLRAHDTYRSLVERKNRCVRINYERLFHLDILPACPDLIAGEPNLLIPDSKMQAFSHTNPKGFIQWFQEQALKVRPVRFSSMAMDSAAPLPEPQAWQQKQVLQLAVQLFKRWRDLYYAGAVELAPVSIVLTTLAGLHYDGERQILAALETIVAATLASLPRYGRLVVSNPKNAKEDLSDRWNDPTVYDAFVHGMRAFEESLRELRDSETITEATKLIKQLFGEDVTRTVFAEQLREMEPARRSESLGVTSAAILSNLSAVASTPVRANTFYGD